MATPKQIKDFAKKFKAIDKASGGSGYLSGGSSNKSSSSSTPAPSKYVNIGKESADKTGYGLGLKIGPSAPTYGAPAISTKTGGATTGMTSSTKSMNFPVSPGAFNPVNDPKIQKDLAVYTSSLNKKQSGGGQVADSYSSSDSRNSSVSSLARTGSPTSSSPTTTSFTSSTFSAPSMGDISSVTTAPRLPQAPAPTNFLGLTNAYTTAAGVTDATGAIIPAVAEPKEDPNLKMQQDLIRELKREEPERLDREAIMEQAGYNQALKEANDLKNRINSISAQAQANILQLRGTAAQEGVTEAVYGGQQAQIERETAIKLMPLTAQYEAAVGNLEAAKEIVNNFIADENKYQDRVMAWKNDIYDKVWSIATTAQKTAIEDRRIKDANQREDEKNFLAQQGQYINTAIANGQGYLIDGILKATNYNELFSQASKIIKESTTKRDTSWQDINGQRVLVDNQTGEVISDTSGSTSSGNQVKASLDQINFLRTTAKEANELAPASGKGIWDRISGWLTGSSKYNQLEAKTNTLRTNVLTLMTDPSVKKYFGPQMSEADVRLMTAAGTTLNPEFNTPEQLTSEIKRLDDLFNRMQTALRTGVSGGNVITAPNGDIVELVD